jgi:hypothetical protein
MAMSSTLPPAVTPQGGPSSTSNDQRDGVTVALALILVGVIALVLLVAVNDDDASSVQVTAGASTATTQSGSSDSGSSGSGGSGGSDLPPGEYQFTLTAPAGTVQYSGSCNVVEGVLTASGAGAQSETIVLSVDVVSQTGAASVAALGTEFEGAINAATVGDGTFDVAGVGTEADDSATGSVQFTVAGTCNTGAAGTIPTATSTASVEPGTHSFVGTIPEGTANLSGTCVVVDGQLTVNGSGASGESLSITADANTQSGSMSIAAAGANYEGTVTMVVIGDGTFEVAGTATPSDDSATGTVPISASGGCDT